MHLDGLLFFPVTPFDDAGEVNTKVLAEHLTAGLAHRPGGVFAACGTGEFHALSVDEYATVVESTVSTVAGAVPVVAGAGGPLPVAVEQARRARALGAAAVLLLPPYLVAAPQRGLVSYVRTVAERADIPVIAYQRANLVLTPDSAAELATVPQVVGLKDGTGDLDRLRQLVLAVRAATAEPFTFFNGLPTAELTADAYAAIGVPLYSSAAFAFAPEIAMAYHRARSAGDPLAARLLDDFYRPLARLRDRTPGYAVSLVKAGVRMRGLDTGPVRPPLVDPTPEEVDELRALTATGQVTLAAAGESA